MKLSDAGIQTEMLMVSVVGKDGTRTKMCTFSEAMKEYGGLDVVKIEPTEIPVMYNGKSEIQPLTVVTLKGSL